MIRWIGAVLALAIVALAAGLAAAGASAAGFGVDETLSSADSSSPVVAFAPNGFGAVAWVEDVGGGQSAVRVAVRPPGGPWSAPQLLGASVTSKSRVGVAIDAAGRAALAWQEFTSPSTYRVAVSTRPAGGAFGAPELLTDGTTTMAPAIGIDGAGQVTLVYNPAPAVSARTFAAGSSALAASPQPIASGCGQIFDDELAVAPSGDAVAGFGCSGAAFALRKGGTWSVSTPVPNTVGTPCPAPSASISNRPLTVAIDAQGHPVGLLETDTNQPDITCSGFGSSITTIDERLVLPLAGVMTPVGGTPAATGTTPPFGLVSPILGAGVGIGGGGIIFSWAASTNGFSYQPAVRFFGTDGSPAGAAQPVGPAISGGSISPQLAVGGDGRALLTWTQANAGHFSVVASVRPPGGAFGDPVAVSAGGDAFVASRAALDDAGDGAVPYLEGLTTSLVHVRAFDVAPPSLDAVAIPASATAGVPAAFAANASDVWGPVTLAWSFGDGEAASGGAPAHAFAHAGTFTVTVTASDAAGNAVSRSGDVHVAAPAPPESPARTPQLAHISLTNARFRVGTGPTAVSALARAAGAAAPPSAAAARARRARVPVGTTFRFTLDVAATVTIAIERPVAGRLSGKRCVKPTRRLRGHRPCTRLVRAGTLTRRLPAGPARVPFSGKIGRKPLAPGSYRTTLTPKALALTGAARRVSFQVVR